MKERRARVLQVSYSKFLRDARKNEIGTITVAGDRSDVETEETDRD